MTIHSGKARPAVRVRQVHRDSGAAGVSGWARLLGTEFAALDLTALEPLEASLGAIELGPVRLTDLRTTASRFLRSEREIALGIPDSAQFIVVVDGQVNLEQLGRAAVLRPGDACLAEPLHQCAVEFATGTRSLALEVPRNLIALSTSELADLAAVRLDGQQGLVGVTADFLRGLMDSGPGLDPLQRTELGGAVVGLLSALMRTVRTEATPAGPGLLESVRTHIDRRLGEPELTPATIAEAHHISLRFLYRLFEGQPETVAAYIRRRRLESARRDLADPALAQLSVTEVAQRWGMPDASRFSQAFRKHFGHTPTGVRAMATKEPAAR